MAKCSVCGNKVSFWSAYNDDNKDYCKDCFNKKEKDKEEKKIREEIDEERKYKEKNKKPTFIFQKGEKIIKDAERLQYAGPTLMSIGSGAALGSGLTDNTSIGSAFFSSKQVKREGSVWDAKPSHLYITNKRIIFCNAKITLFGREEISIGTPFSEIIYKNIKGINSSMKLGNPAIDISVVNGNSMDNLKFWFLGSEEQRGKERDEFLNLIKKQIK